MTEINGDSKEFRLGLILRGERLAKFRRLLEAWQGRFQDSVKITPHGLAWKLLDWGIEAAERKMTKW